MKIENVRNFSIIAHIDHGKSTLADRILEFTHTLTQREMKAQVLDSMDLERERGITIKAHAIRMDYKAKDAKTYQLNLIDTPGHVDFTYEVSRNLAACEGAVLVVDASQGIEAQTISNLFLAQDNNLTIIPVINKIDLPNTREDVIASELTELLGITEDEIILASAKEGIGTEEILEAVVTRVPPPEGDPNAPLRALIFDSLFDSYRGAVPYVRIVDGKLRSGMEIKLFTSKTTYEVTEVGNLKLGWKPQKELSVGQVGYLIASIKNVSDLKVGDTVIDVTNPPDKPLPGYKDIKPMVFSGIYPATAEDYDELKDALEKLKLNDASLLYEPETSKALGFGFRCGFLGLLHMEIVQERLSREFDLEIINTVPNVKYRVYRNDGGVVAVENPTSLPPASEVDHLEEPFMKVRMFLPKDYIGAIMKLCQDRRGEFVKMDYIDSGRVEIEYKLPLAEIILDFYDKLKTFSRGYASMDYEFLEYRESNLVKLDLLVNGEPVDALSVIIHKDKAYHWGRQLSEKLRQLIPRQLYEVIIQAAIGSKVISREVIRALRKNVLAKCYGGDVTRKRKLLEKQREGKRRMKQVGRVEIPQEAFLAALKIES